MKAKLVYNKQEVVVNIPKTLELLSLSCNVVSLLISDEIEYVDIEDEEPNDYIEELLDYADDTLLMCYNHIHTHYLKIAKKHFTMGEGIKIRYNFTNESLLVNFTDSETELTETEEEKKDFMSKINDVLKGK